MAKLAIKGHATRGNEVVELLEMLGGKNDRIYGCNVTDYAYIIDEQGIIDWDIPLPDSPFAIFTLEEFLEKFPYKVGDKVQHKGATSYGFVFAVEKMRWVNNNVEYTVRRLRYNNCRRTLTAEGLQPYKEETMDKVSKAVFDANAQCCDITNRLIKEETMEEKSEQITVDIPNGYEFFGIDDNNKIVLTKKQLQYPKTYEECAQILLERASVRNDIGHKGDLLIALQRLLVCRDAYWKIAGEQMGLGEPWKPDWLNTEQDKFVLYTHNNVICLNRFVLGHNVLAFPTAEMRDAFLDNFKELIESCKELL